MKRLKNIFPRSIIQIIKNVARGITSKLLLQKLIFTKTLSEIKFLTEKRLLVSMKEGKKTKIEMVCMTAYKKSSHNLHYAINP